MKVETLSCVAWPSLISARTAKETLSSVPCDPPQSSAERRANLRRMRGDTKEREFLSSGLQVVYE